MNAYQKRDLGDGNPIPVQECARCGIAPSAVDDCGIPDAKCPHFGIDAQQARPKSAAELDAAYQAGFKDLKPGEVCPPCPSCGGKMEPWEYWLITGAKCSCCGWGMTEGTGALL